MPSPHGDFRPTPKRKRYSEWQPHDEPAEGSRQEIEESNRQASQSRPLMGRLPFEQNKAEPSDSGPEYFGH